MALPKADLSPVALVKPDLSAVALVKPDLSAVALAKAETLNPQPSTLNSLVLHHRARRTGRIACLPKLQRDMVNRMISNGVPYKNIVCALDEAGFTVTERNISNWATGGYLEWQFGQDLVLQNRLDQDHLLDHLRRDDASDLPEVGLQAAATRLSQILLLKTARADDLEANLGNVSQMVDLLSRLTRELSALQKQRDDSRRSLGRAHDPARIKEKDQSSAAEDERFYSDPPKDSGLAKPDEPPLLPAPSTADFLAQCDREDAEAKQAAHHVRFMGALQAFAKKPNGSNVPQASPPAGAEGVPPAKSPPPTPPAR
jgi:hypothetical protein